VQLALFVAASHEGKRSRHRAAAAPHPAFDEVPDNIRPNRVGDRFAQHQYPFAGRKRERLHALENVVKWLSARPRYGAQFKASQSERTVNCTADPQHLANKSWVAASSNVMGKSVEVFTSPKPAPRRLRRKQAPRRLKNLGFHRRIPKAPELWKAIAVLAAARGFSTFNRNDSD
jgi:hypothetical protein